jgi:hypothetical protein
VELHELKYVSAQRKFSVRIAQDAVRVRTVDGKKRETFPRFVGDEKTGDAFIDVSGTSRSAIT